MVGGETKEAMKAELRRPIHEAAVRDFRNSLAELMTRPLEGNYADGKRPDEVTFHQTLCYSIVQNQSWLPCGKWKHQKEKPCVAVSVYDPSDPEEKCNNG